MRYQAPSRFAVIACAGLGCARAALAQEGSKLEATLGVGTGSGTIMCEACTHAGNMRGSTWTLQLSSSPGPSVRVGANVDYWAHSTDTWERDLWSVSVVAFYYPGTVDRGFFIGGGPNYAMMYASLTDTSALQRHGWGVLTEMGYELRPRAKWSLTPYVQYSYARVGDIFYPKDSPILWASNWRHSVVSVGLGITYHAHHSR